MAIGLHQRTNQQKTHVSVGFCPTHSSKAATIIIISKVAKSLGRVYLNTPQPIVWRLYHRTREVLQLLERR